jgi:hypothetical protein
MILGGIKVLSFYLVFFGVYFAVVRLKYPFLYKKHVLMAREFFCNFEWSFTLSGIFSLNFTYIYRIVFYLTILLPYRVFVNNGLSDFHQLVGWCVNLFFLVCWDYGMAPISLSIYMFFFDAFTFILLYVYIKPFRKWVIYRCNLTTDFKNVIWFFFGNPLSKGFKNFAKIAGTTAAFYGLWEYEVQQADLKFYATCKDHISLLKEVAPDPMTNHEVSEQIEKYHNRCLDEKALHQLIGKRKFSWNLDD